MSKQAEGWSSKERREGGESMCSCLFYCSVNYLVISYILLHNS